MYDVLIRGDRWIVLMLSPIVRGVHQQRCWKRGSGDGQRLSLYDYGMTERRVGLCLCFLPLCVMHNDNAVGNVVAETGRVFMTTARLSDLSMPLKGEVRRSPEQSAWQPIARSGKFVGRPSSRRALGCEETAVSCFAPWWSTLLFERGLGEEGRFDVASRSQTQKPTCQSHKQRLLRPCSGPSIQAALTRTTGVKEQQVLSKYQKRNQFKAGMGRSKA